MSLHTAKAHLSNAGRNAQNTYEKELAAALAAMVSGLSSEIRALESRLRNVEQEMKAARSRGR